MDYSVAAYSVTAQASDGGQVTLGPMTIAAALSEASRLTAEGFSKAVIRLNGSSYEVDLEQYLKSLKD